jgi:hypothetical protein
MDDKDDNDTEEQVKALARIAEKVWNTVVTYEGYKKKLAKVEKTVGKPECKKARFEVLKLRNLGYDMLQSSVHEITKRKYQPKYAADIIGHLIAFMIDWSEHNCKEKKVGHNMNIRSTTTFRFLVVDIGVFSSCPISLLVELISRWEMTTEKLFVMPISDVLNTLIGKNDDGYDDRMYPPTDADEFLYVSKFIIALLAVSESKGIVFEETQEFIRALCNVLIFLFNADASIDERNSKVLHKIWDAIDYILLIHINAVEQWINTKLEEEHEEDSDLDSDLEDEFYELEGYHDLKKYIKEWKRKMKRTISIKLQETVVILDKDIADLITSMNFTKY